MANEYLVAPEELTIKDFGQNVFTYETPVINEIDTALRILTTEGHATRGHCGFGGLEFGETSQIDIARHLFTEPMIQKIRERVTQEVEATSRFDDELIDILFGIKNSNTSRLIDHTTNKLKFADPKTGEILFGFGINRKTQFAPTKENIITALQGRVKANLMDSDHYRDLTVQRFQKAIDGTQLTIGTGTCMVGHLGNIRNKKISLEKLASEVQDPEYIDFLLKQKCLVNNPNKSNMYNPELFSVFIRTAQGLGCCDDLTTLGIGFQAYDKGFESAKLAYVSSRNSDYVDTVDKFGAHPLNGGSDESHGKHVQERYSKLARKENLELTLTILQEDYKIRTSIDELNKAMPNQICPKTLRNFIHKKTGNVTDTSQYKGQYLPSEIVSDEEITTAIYFGAKNNTPNFSESSSVRRFEENQHIFKSDGTSTGQTMNTTKSHLHYLRTGEATPGLKIGFKRIESADFYDIASQRLDAFCNFGLFPEPQFQRFE